MQCNIFQMNKALVADPRVTKTELLQEGQFFQVHKTRIANLQAIDLNGIDTLEPRGKVELVIHRADGSSDTLALLSRIDTSSELDQIKHKGILPMVLRDIIKANT